LSPSSASVKYPIQNISAWQSSRSNQSNPEILLTLWKLFCSTLTFFPIAVFCTNPFTETALRDSPGPAEAEAPIQCPVLLHLLHFIESKWSVHAGLNPIQNARYIQRPVSGRPPSDVFTVFMHACHKKTAADVPDIKLQSVFPDFYQKECFQASFLTTQGIYSLFHPAFCGRVNNDRLNNDDLDDD
jgi:hypothetical protein